MNTTALAMIGRLIGGFILALVTAAAFAAPWLFDNSDLVWK